MISQFSTRPYDPQPPKPYDSPCKTMVNGTPCKRGFAAVAALPDELFQWEILVRLPAKELLRCRAVCRSWCRLASAASRRSLILISCSNHRFYLCNPATRQWCALPDLTGGNVAALYPHHSSCEYRILYWKHPNNSDDNVVYYYVLTVGKKERCIGLPVASSSINKKDRSRWHLHACHHPPVLLHDCLHWYTVNAFDGAIVIFDTLAESFRMLRYDNYVECLYGKVVSENGDMLLISRNCWSQSLFHCDSKGELIEIFVWSYIDPKVLGLCFKQSLVRHVFFERKDGKRVRLPRFLQGRLPISWLSLSSLLIYPFHV
ncbi:hypothetical protein VPH35_057074 [Triticum aestivum]